MLLALNVDRIGSGRDMNQNNALGATPVWFFLPFHSRLRASFSGSWCLRTFSFIFVAAYLISFPIVGWEDQSSSPSTIILNPTVRLGRAWFFEWTRTSFCVSFSLMRTGQILALQCFAFFGKGIPSESKKEWWSSEYFWPLFSPRVLPSNAASWGWWLASGRDESILTMCFFFPWKIQPPSEAFGAFLRKLEASSSPFRASNGLTYAHFLWVAPLCPPKRLKISFVSGVLLPSAPFSRLLSLGKVTLGFLSEGWAKGAFRTLGFPVGRWARRASDSPSAWSFLLLVSEFCFHFPKVGFLFAFLTGRDHIV